MSHTIGVTHEDEHGKEAYVELEFSGVSIDSGKAPRMNPPGKAHPGYPPAVSGIGGIEVVLNEFDHEVDADLVYESHQEYFDDELLEAEGRRRRDLRHEEPPGV